MRFFVGILASVVKTRRQRRNLRLLGWLGLFFVLMLGSYSVLFHWLMAREGQSHSWVTAVYWTFVTMSTLGFGDITFQSDAGRLFTIVVLMSGTIFLLVLLPFSFIQFFFLPWMEAQEASGTPRSLPVSVRGHVILTQLKAVEESLIKLLVANGIEHVIVVGSTTEAGPLLDAGYQVMVGPLDDPETYRQARVEQAALVATTRADTTNTNVTFTVREVSPMVPVVATASSDASVDILNLAGASQVLRMGQMLGAALARRVLGRDGRSRVIGQFDDLRIAEAAVGPTGLAGRTLAETRLRQEVGVTVVGTWYRGGFKPATPETLLHRSSLLVLAGSAEQLAGYDQQYAVPGLAGGLTLIIGSGRVGRAVAAALAADGQAFTIIDKDPDRIHDADRGLVGDAARREVLEQAGIDRCSAVVITPRDDDMNVYLTLYCRKLRPDIQILSRATLDRNVSTLHRAGADFVMSYATTGATTIYNLLRRIDILLLAEGLHIFRVDTPPELAGQRLGESRIRQQTGCTVVAVGQADHFSCNPVRDAVLAPASELVLIGDADAESRFLERFPGAAARPSDNSVLVADGSQVAGDRYAERNEELS